MEAVSDTDPEQNLSLPALTFRPQPTTVEETGLDDSQCVDLVLKTLRSGGRLSGGEIANRLCLSFRIIETILNFLKQELMIETVAAAAVTEQQFEYSLTSKGNEKAAEALERNEYIGPAPVSLRDYVEVFNQQSGRDQKVTPDAVRDALSDLELDHDFHRHLGAAVNGGHSILLYGASPATARVRSPSGWYACWAAWSLSPTPSTSAARPCASLIRGCIRQSISRRKKRIH